MRLAFAEIRRAKLRFGLLTGAVALLVFLILFQQTLAGALLGSFTGAIERQSAQVLVFGKDARGSVEGSVVSPQQVAQVAAVDGVERAAPIGEGTFSVDTGTGGLTSTTIFGYELGGPGAPTTLSQGRLPEADGEAVVSADASSPGFDLGASVTVVPGDTPIRIVGLASDAQFSVQPTLYASYATYVAVTEAANPDAKAVLPSLIGVDPRPGVSAEQVAASINEQVPGVQAKDRAAAAAELPGVSSIQQSFNVILLLAFIVVVLITGFFFLILTVQKTQALILLRAVGAGTGYLLKNLAIQVAVVTLAAVALASALLWVVAATSSQSLSISADPGLILVTGTAVLVLALVAAAGAMRRVVRLDPALATARATGGGLA